MRTPVRKSRIRNTTATVLAVRPNDVVTNPTRSAQWILAKWRACDHAKPIADDVGVDGESILKGAASAMVLIGASA